MSDSSTERRSRRIRVAAFAASSLVALSGSVLPAETGAQTLRCATVLTAAELAAITPQPEENGSVDRGEGHSECSWKVRGAGESNTVSLTFWEPEATTQSLVPADSPEAFYEMLVKSAEDTRGASRQALKGAGLRSALFRSDAQREVYVLSRAGVAHLVADGLTDAQVEAIARAVAAP